MRSYKRALHTKCDCEFHSTGSGFEEAASMMAAAAKNECPVFFACSDAVGVEESRCPDGEVRNVLDLSGLFQGLTRA